MINYLANFDLKIIILDHNKNVVENIDLASVKFIGSDLDLEQSWRIDLLLTKILMHNLNYGFSRSKIQKMIIDGLILVNGKFVKTNLKINAHDIIEIILPIAKPSLILPQNIPFEIIYEDKYLAIINKPSGLTVHPGAGINDCTLANALMYRFAGNLSSSNLALRPGIIHRLDKDTSGIMIIAKSDECHGKFATLFKNRLIQKTYIALVEGIPKSESGRINLAIARNQINRKIMSVDVDGKEALTDFKILKHNNKYALLELKPKTGRTHQLRVHLSYLNLPIVGDCVYNNKVSGSSAFRRDHGINGQLLHALNIEFKHPFTNQDLSFNAKIPDFYNNAVKNLLGENVL